MSVQLRRVGIVSLVAGMAVLALAQAAPPGEHPNLGPVRVEHDQITSGAMTFGQIRNAGMMVFTTPFNKLDGYGDGPMDLSNTVDPGGRPTLQGNGTLLRVNGLDAQSCLECHSILSNTVIPPRLGIGGVGGSVTNAMIMPTAMDPADLDDLDSIAEFNGRFANPPFIFGAGAVELLAMEMTQELQQQKQWALDNPGTVVPLQAKGLSFGTIVADAFGDLDTTAVEGVDADLVVKPFGRKGEFATTRDFDIAATQFHFGMQPVEVVGADVDADGDGVINEIKIGELSALHVFVSTMPKPEQKGLTAEAVRGFNVFQAVGCASCHLPEMQTNGAELPLRFPSDPVDPSANVYYSVDLSKSPAKFEKNGLGGLVVPLFADLKRHDMGDALAESFSLATDQQNREFTTARLWGIGDTAPYLHDGRATTLTEAIMFHGGEAQTVRDNFVAISDQEKSDLLSFLRTLRTPENPLRGRGSPGRVNGGPFDSNPLRQVERSDGR